MKEQPPPADRFSEGRTGLRVWVEEHQKRSNMGACIETHCVCGGRWQVVSVWCGCLVSAVPSRPTSGLIVPPRAWI